LDGGLTTTIVQGACLFFKTHRLRYSHTDSAYFEIEIT
jgi:hypothetical protein